MRLVVRREKERERKKEKKKKKKRRTKEQNPGIGCEKTFFFLNHGGLLHTKNNRSFFFCSSCSF